MTYYRFKKICPICQTVFYTNMTKKITCSWKCKQEKNKQYQFERRYGKPKYDMVNIPVKGKIIKDEHLGNKIILNDKPNGTTN